MLAEVYPDTVQLEGKSAFEFQFVANCPKPGTLEEKVNPYLRPLYDALQDTLPDDIVAKLIESGKIEVAPLAFMRGRTLSNAFVILDEAQNTTAVQMKMFLTRLGENSRAITAICGIPSQSAVKPCCW